MRVHFLGVSGTGMGSLAALFREAGHTVTGSDVAFDPPVGPILRAAGIELFQGYDPANLGKAAPELVVVGNAIRKDNPEAAAAASAPGLPCVSMSGALHERFLTGRRPLVVTGTHGKTTTSAMCAWLLASAGFEPGWFIGGIPKNLPQSAAIGRAGPTLVSAASAHASRSPFVVEGDEYDAVYWHKKPKFLDYVGVAPDEVVILTSVEHDHIDIYPTQASYEAAFAELLAKLSPEALVVCDAHDARAVRLVRAHASSGARVSYYALEGDETFDVTPTWLGAPAVVAQTTRGPAQSFDLFASGVFAGRFAQPLVGAHNVRNAVAAIAACAEGFGARIPSLRTALAGFEGVKRRQEHLATLGGIVVYDDFAHHPTAVDVTLRGIRARHEQALAGGGHLWAVFEPRSATACRNIHQAAYAKAFGAADKVLLAPVGRAIPEAERLDVPRLARELGPKATACPSVDTIVPAIAEGARPGDVVAVLSNGAFGGLKTRLVEALSKGTSATEPEARA
jgi:UDP-N-acetylmuramate: L-alanyl-gamma-D-glutamyl-meso-diaminopimelate ligase